MIKRITALFFFTITLVFSLTSLSCAGSVNNYGLPAELSEKVFYSKPDLIIKEVFFTVTQSIRLLLFFLITANMSMF